MSKTEFYTIFKQLCDYYKSKTYEDKDITNLYYEIFKDKTTIQLKEQIKEIIVKYKFMPKVADLTKRKSNFEQREYNKEFLESFYDIGGKTNDY